MATQPLSFKPGDIRTRAQIRQELGGSPQGGITPSKEMKTVVLYSDIKSGEKYGYRDGWLRYEDRIGPIFEYTGAGTHGDHTFTGTSGNGNRAVLQHAEMKRTLHLFIGHGKVSGSGIRTHRYIGAFELDKKRGYIVRQAPDEYHNMRDVIVFRLRPLDEYDQTASDILPAAKKTAISFIPARGRRRISEPTVPIDAEQRSTSAANSIWRNQTALTEEFENDLSAHEQDFGRLEGHARGVEETIQATLYNRTKHTIYEPTGSTSRTAYKDALIQLIDISRYLNSTEGGMPLRCMVLAPELPDEDIRQLLFRSNVGIVYRNADGSFTEIQDPDQQPAAGGVPGIPPCHNCPVLQAS
ncbi:hypothetical protein [Streptomyces beijiangensis]|uniref:ScoMcrA-like SRA domain-containing protein n=1 Tax=Streptomyces beijiangensis TaxID=163361 RepID=A0A939FC69_9ACTN|nr:hypothetical protein [Streptomyces beijiangensis]MBO0515531.1 hypothetical protein [Streptomyces beijiangensis]